MARSLRFWLSLGFSTFVALALVLVLSSLLWVLIPRMNAQIEAKNNEFGQTVAAQIERFLLDARDELDGFAHDMVLRPSFERDRWLLMAETLIRSDPHLEAIYLLDDVDRVVDVALGAAHPGQHDDLVGTDFSGRSFVSKARKSDQHIWSDSYLSQRGRIVAALVVPVRFRNPGGVVITGSLIGEFNLDQLSSQMLRISQLGEVLPIILDKKGQIVAHPDIAYGRHQENLSMLPILQARTSAPTQTGTFALDGVDYIGSTTLISDLQWTVLVAQPIDKAYATVRSTLWALALASAMAVLLAIGAALWVSRRMSAEVANFGRHMQAIADGDYNAVIARSSTDEIEVLAQSMRRMVAAVLQREAHNKAINQSAHDAIITADAEGKIIGWNRGAQTIFGYSEAEILQQPLTILMPEHYRARHLAGMARIDAGSPTTIIGQTVQMTGRRKDASEFPIDISLAKWESAQGWFVTGIVRDITERQRAQDEIQRLAFTDPLTGLPNRRLLVDRLERSMASALRHGNQAGLLFVDMDDFKLLNDSLGHAKGDLLLKQIASRIASCVREGDSVARLGGDEFVVLLDDLSTGPAQAMSEAELVAKKILHALRQPYLLNGSGYHSTASIGITLFGSGQRESIDAPLQRAEMAMYKAKAAGRDNLLVFEPEMGEAMANRASLEADLHRALEQHQFELYYQVQVDPNARPTGVEALLRWHHPTRGLVPPAEFIPVAESSGLIVPLGQWVLETACQQLSAWSTQPERAHLTMSVNVSARQFRLPNFVAIVQTICKTTAIKPGRLMLELTESLLLDNMRDVVDKMNALKAEGICFSLDDFGTGYSSLSYLKRLPLDELKIDQSFVKDILNDPNDAAIAKMVVVLADSMGLEVIAEGVETQAQREALAAYGCHAYQGYLFGRPAPIGEFEATPVAVS